MTLELNCDLGEGGVLEPTEDLMEVIDAASVACGGHAGDSSTMRRCIRLARRHGVKLGAHPGRPDQAGGRGSGWPTVEELRQITLEQSKVLAALAAEEGLVLHHVKLHGVLYHAAEQSGELARALLAAVRQLPGAPVVYALAGGLVEREAAAAGVRVHGEIFADRAYRPDGSLVPRGEPGALLTSVSEITDRLRVFLRSGFMPTVDGGSVALHGRTLCVHSDTPGAVEIARTLRPLVP